MGLAHLAWRGVGGGSNLDEFIQKLTEIHCVGVYGGTTITQDHFIHGKLLPFSSINDLFTVVYFDIYRTKKIMCR